MTMLDVRRLSQYAKKYPPVRVLMTWCAQALGIELPKPPSKTPESAPRMTLEQARAFAALAQREMTEGHGG